MRLETILNEITTAGSVSGVNQRFGGGLITRTGPYSPKSKKTKHGPIKLKTKRRKKKKKLDETYYFYFGDEQYETTGVDDDPGYYEAYSPYGGHVEKDDKKKKN